MTRMLAATILLPMLTGCVTTTRYQYNPSDPPPTSCVLRIDNKGGFVNGGRCVASSK